MKERRPPRRALPPGARTLGSDGQPQISQRYSASYVTGPRDIGPETEVADALRIMAAHPRTVAESSVVLVSPALSMVHGMLWRQLW